MSFLSSLTSSTSIHLPRLNRRLMALRQLLVSITKHNPPNSPTVPTICYNKSSSTHINTAERLPLTNISRRAVTAAAIMAYLPIADAALADGFELNLQMVAPDQTLEEAKAGIEDHAQALLEVKSLLNSDSWVEAQKELRRSSSLLKQDIYTIIQAKPGSERPQLRNLYSKLFKNVTNLDYAAREKDAARVWHCYDNIALVLADILSKI